IIDYYKNKKDDAGLRRWVENIRKGGYRVSSGYVEKLKLYLLAHQFEEVQKATTAGDKKKALLGYLSIYRHKESSAEAKKNSAYNITLLFHELGDTKRTLAWMNQAMALMSAKEIADFEGSFLAIVGELFNRQHFDEAAAMYEKVLLKLCQEKTKNKEVFFKNANTIYLAQDKIDESKGLVKEAERCGVSSTIIREAQLDLLESLVSTRRWSSVEDTVAALEPQKDLWPDLIYPLYLLKVEYDRSGKSSKSDNIENKIMRLYEYCAKQKMNIPLAALDAVAQYSMVDLEREVRKLDNIALEFPDDLFKKRLKAKYEQLDLIVKKAKEVFAIRSGKGVVRAYKHIVESYQKVADEIKNFTPAGKTEDYINSFRKSMGPIVANTASKAMEFRTQGRDQIIKNKILSNDNYWFLSQSNYPLKVEYDYNLGGIIMDRGGKR
ncbi:MAG: hypothetical protein WCG27_11545, partial [Pseudomonadota bacterium]